MSTGTRWIHNSMDDYSVLLHPELLLGFNHTGWCELTRCSSPAKQTDKACKAAGDQEALDYVAGLRYRNASYRERGWNC